MTIDLKNRYAILENGSCVSICNESGYPNDTFSDDWGNTYIVYETEVTLNHHVHTIMKQDKILYTSNESLQLADFEREILIRFLEIYNNPYFFGDVVSSSMVCRKNENKNKIKKVCASLRKKGYLKHVWQERMYIGLDGFPCDEEFVPLHGYELTENAKNLDFMRKKKKELDDEFEKYWNSNLNLNEV